jgi:hypothetical protein
MVVCSRIRLSSLMHNQETLMAFVKPIAIFCVDLRLDYLHWMNTVDIRRLLLHFRWLVRFHTGNVALSKRTLIHDVQRLFPHVKSLTLLLSLGENTFLLNNNTFQAICTSLRDMRELESISLIVEDKTSNVSMFVSRHVHLVSLCHCI